MTPKTPTIVTDLDGTLVNLMDEVIAGIWQAFGVALQPGECIKYSVHESFWEFLQHDFNSVEALNQFLIRNFWTNIAVLDRCKPYWDMWCAYTGFRKAGGTIIGLTSRAPTPAIVEVTQAWLERWGLGSMKVLFSRRHQLAEPDAKLEDCRDLVRDHGSPLWFVDDQPATCEKVAAADLPGMTVYMVERPWTHYSFGSAGVKKHYIIQDMEEVLRRTDS